MRWVLWMICLPSLLVAVPVQAHAQEAAAASVPSTYRAISTRTALAEPSPPTLGAAGYQFRDPTFGSPIVRVTDANTRPGFPGRSFTTPSAAHQLAWNMSSTRFYLRSVDGTIIPYTFDAITMTASRIQPAGTGNGGLTISSQVEPQFSFRSPAVLFGSRQDSTNDWPVIRQFDFDSLTYADIVNLGQLTSINQHTYAGALSSSAVAPEKLAALFGGAAQDGHYKLAVFNTTSAVSSAVVLDTIASTITTGGKTVSTNIAMGVFLHHAWLDQSGRYVLLETTGQMPVPYFLWDLVTGLLSQLSTRPNGHMATGFAYFINQDCCTSTAYDAAQWQRRQLASPAATTDLINPVLTPQETYLAEHTSWNNAQSGSLVPVLSSLYRYYDGGLNTVPWRAWDNEIVGIQTNNGASGASVWRFAHHRSNVAADNGAATYFWYLPRANVSPDGWWALFSSNWEKTLGSTVGSDVEPGGAYRADVFLVALTKGGLDTFTDDPLTPGVTPIRLAHVTELRVRIDAVRSRVGLAPYGWTPIGVGTLIRAVHITEMRTALGQAFTAAGRPVPSFADSVLVTGITPVRVVHIQELRDAVIALETG